MRLGLWACIFVYLPTKSEGREQDPWISSDNKTWRDSSLPDFPIQSLKSALFLSPIHQTTHIYNQVINFILRNFYLVCFRSRVSNSKSCDGAWSQLWCAAPTVALLLLSSNSGLPLVADGCPWTPPSSSTLVAPNSLFSPPWFTPSYETALFFYWFLW